MTHTQLLLRDEEREKLLRGATALAEAMRVTLGPCSKSVLIGKKYGTEATLTEVEDEHPARKRTGEEPCE